MGLFKLNYTNNDLSDGFMEKANKEPIDYEKDFENWLENSPHILFEDDSSTIMWIGRQVSTNTYETTKFPDLIGIDAEGNIVVVELKKGKTPREVVAQILEYAAWASKLSYEELNVLTMKYYDDYEEYKNKELIEIHNSIFNPDNEIISPVKFNQNIKMFIVAEEITKTVENVVKFLNSNGGINISCLKYDVYKSSDGEYIISIDIDEPDVVTLRVTSSGWNGDKPVKQIVKTSVEDVLKSKSEGTFTAKEIIGQTLKNYPDCNTTTIRCQIYADCVNHSSRKHYKGGQLDLYYSIGNGKFRMYDKYNDGNWNSNGERIN